VKQYHPDSSSIVSPNSAHTHHHRAAMGCQALDAVLQILFEIVEVEKVRLDEAAVKGPLDQNSQLAHPEHGRRLTPPSRFSPFLWAGPSGELRHRDRSPQFSVAGSAYRQHPIGCIVLSARQG
jgi:hypothetical protein